MFKIEQPCTFIQEIKKSRFRAIATPAADEASAKAALKALSDPAANHNCWAWRIGQAYRFSDDGEPSGTGGKPILQAIDGQSLDGILVVVTRWFGGILLGSGGLVRAYGGTAASCLKQADKRPVIAMRTFSITCNFPDLGVVEGKLKGWPEVRLGAKAFTASGAEMLLEIPEHDQEAVTRMLGDATSGRVIAKARD